MAKKRVKSIEKRNHSSRPDCNQIGLQIPRLCVVFIQTFSLPHFLSFSVPKGTTAKECPNFTLLSESIWSSDSLNPSQTVENYALPGFGFDIQLPLAYNVEKGEFEAFELKGKCLVNMACFFGDTVSLTYHFFFDQQMCESSDPFSIWRLIDFLDFYLTTPFYSKVLESTNSITDNSTATFTDVPFTEDGTPLFNDVEQTIQLNHETGIKEAFASIRQRYKGYIIKHFTKNKAGLSYNTKKEKKNLEVSEIVDTKYAYVELPRNLQDPQKDGSDYFSLDNEFALSDEEVITHIQESHKKELLSLFSLSAIDDSEGIFETYCGDDILDSSDSMAYVGENVALFIETYSRPKDEEKRMIDWTEETRKQYDGVCRPDLLMLLQFCLAKKTVVRNASSVLLRNAVSHGNKMDITNVINRNQIITFVLGQSMLQYDAVRYRHPNFCQIDKRITDRLKVMKDRNEFEYSIRIIDDSLRNIKDGQASSREVTMNIILGIVSVISAFQLFFVGTKMPFLSDFWEIESGTIGALLITIVAGIAIFLVLGFLFSAIRSLFQMNK